MEGNAFLDDVRNREEERLDKGAHQRALQPRWEGIKELVAGTERGRREEGPISRRKGGRINRTVDRYNQKAITSRWEEERETGGEELWRRKKSLFAIRLLSTS